MSTLLLREEVDDNEPNYLKFSRFQLESLQVEELENAIRALVKSILPVYSGAVDHRVNYIDYIKAKLTLADDQLIAQASTDELELMRDFLKLDEQLYSG